jgi:hypothetical protein
MIVMVVVLRTGSLEREIIDWDESTFVLMAADLLRGHLPYVQLFDNKPPGIFLLVAGAIGIFGKSLWAVRLVGDLSVLITALFTYAMVARHASSLTAGLTSMTLIAMSATAYGLHTSAELPATAFMTAALWAATSRPDRLASPLSAGLLASAAILTRANLAIAVLCMGVVYLWPLVYARPRSHRLSAFAFAAGVLVPIAAVFGVYAVAGHLDVAVLSMITVPLAYALHQTTMLVVLKQNVWSISALLQDVPGTYLAPTLLITASACSLLWRAVSATPRRPSVTPTTADGDVLMSVLLCSAAMLGTMLSILRGGMFYLHYWLQLYPYAVFVVAAGAHLATRPALRWLLWVGCVVPPVTAIGERWPSFRRVMTSPQQITARHRIRAIADRLRIDRRDGDEILALNNHLVLWYLDVPPITRIATHPTNLIVAEIVAPLARAGYTEADIFDRVLARRPRHIVSGDNDRFGQMDARQQALLERVLRDDYEIWIREPGVTVYRRLASR